MAVVSIATWNLLAPSFAPASKYPWTSAADLDWGRRQGMIVERLAEIDADVVCLQEVEVALWDGLLDQLEALGYEGVLQETKRSHPVANAVLLRQGVLRVVRTESRSRALITVLESCSRSEARPKPLASPPPPSPPPLYLCNVHLEAGGDKSSTRLNQLRSLLRRVQFQQEADDAENGPLVIAGDFNFDRSADLYQLLAQGALPQTATPTAAARKAAASPLLPLRDSYLETPPPWGPALRSSFRNGRLLDFVWTSPSVSVVRTMPVSDVAGSTQPHQIPSRTHPSDHLPIGALMSWPGAPPPASRRLPAWQDIFVENVQQQQGGGDASSGGKQKTSRKR